MSSELYLQTRQQRIELIKKLIDDCGEYYKIVLQEIKQYNEFAMYVGKMRVDSTFALIKRLPRDYENINGIQRALKKDKVEDIEETIRTNPLEYSLPNSIVVTLEQISDIGFIEIDFLNEDRDIILYKINLKLLLNKLLQDNSNNSSGTIADEIFCGILCDGHHRLQGLLAGEATDFEVPITAYIQLPKQEIYKIFVGINKFQGKPSSVHTLAMEEQAGKLVGEDEQAARIIYLLNTDMGNTDLTLGMPENDINQPTWSILFDRIKTVDAKRPTKSRKTYVTSSTFHKLIKDNVLDAINTNLSVDRKAEILNDYFTAWAECFPVAWNDTRYHILVKSMGFQIMVRLFPTIYSLLVNDKIPNKDDMKKFIDKTLKGENNTLDLGVGVLPINWESENFGGYSSGKGINTISKLLRQHINRIAQPNE